VGLRQARKHLVWALDIAAAPARAPAHLLKMWRGRVLTATDPALVLQHLAEAFDALGACHSSAHSRESGNPEPRVAA
jgi:tRNA-dihydrouridine synthase B